MAPTIVAKHKREIINKFLLFHANYKYNETSPYYFVYFIEVRSKKKYSLKFK